MIGPEGGYYSHNTFKVDREEIEHQAPGNENAAGMHPVFAEFPTAKLLQLTSGPLNQIGWLAGDLNHAVVSYLSGDTINAMRAYVNETDTEERKRLGKEIIAGFEEASERQLDEAA